ncbi:MAG: hypothetical protein ACI8V2_004693 [Candidatus Latescibacterota bacterium]
MRLWMVFVLCLGMVLKGAVPVSAEDYIQPYKENPFFWQLKGEPVLLLGGTVEDNVYQISNLEAHLDLLASVGGNYVRCTMSCRDEGDVWWFEKDGETGLYDLNKPGEEHWARFENFMKLTSERGIVAQFEMWDRFDFARENWEVNPYNPKNNVNYSGEESGLVEEYKQHPGRKENPFFRSVPALENNRLILEYQHKQVDRMLSVTLQYGHVLYCIDNETNESPEWGTYWSDYIKAKAKEAGVTVMTTEMWDAHNLLAEEHKATFDHPETYDFVDVSQNNHQVGKVHWDNPLAVRQYVIDSGHIRPMNTVKIYGANTGSYGTTRDAQERFWRNILVGMAGTRFHRPPSGLGLSDIAQSHIESMRMALTEHDIFKSVPRLDLIGGRSGNEAYCSANVGESYLVFFPDGGNVSLDVSDMGDQVLTIQWLDIRNCMWADDEVDVRAIDGKIRLVTPDEEGYWAAVVK